jgi:hypothetical protein
MIAEAGFCGVTGLTHSLDLEGTTFIPSHFVRARTLRNRLAECPPSAAPA